MIYDVVSLRFVNVSEEAAASLYKATTRLVTAAFNKPECIAVIKTTLSRFVWDDDGVGVGC